MSLAEVGEATAALDAALAAEDDDVAASLAAVEAQMAAAGEAAPADEEAEAEAQAVPGSEAASASDAAPPTDTVPELSSMQPPQTSMCAPRARTAGTRWRVARRCPAPRHAAPYRKTEWLP
jgi:hypothetical protein